MYTEEVKNIIKRYNEKNPQCNLSSEGTHESLAKYIVDELQMNDIHIVSGYDCDMC